MSGVEEQGARAGRHWPGEGAGRRIMRWRAEEAKSFGSSRGPRRHAMITRHHPFVAAALCLMMCVSVRAFAAPVNVAVGGVARQSSDFPGAASRAIDGNRDGNWAHGSVTHTSNRDPDPDPQLFEWWEVQLDRSYSIGRIILFNRTDCCGSRLIPCRVSLYSGTAVACARDVSRFVTDISGSGASGMTIELNGQVGNRVRVQLTHQDYLSLAEVEVYGEELLPVPALAPIPANRYVVMSLPVFPLPGSRLSSVLGDLGAPGAYTWRGFGVISGTYAPDPVMQPGQAFILCSTEAAMPTFRGSALTDSITVPLAPGWNLVGCVGCGAGVYPWSACTVITGDAERSLHDQSDVTPCVLWYADDTGDLSNNGLWEWLYGTELLSTPPAQANPWGGYLMYARDPCTLVFRKQAASAALTIGPSAGAAVPSAAAGDWSIRLYAEAGGTRDGWLGLGVGIDLSAGQRHLDMRKPPSFGDGVQLSVVREYAPGGPLEGYLTDFRRQGEESYTWDLTLGYVGSRTLDGTARLVWQELAEIPPEWHVYLLTGESRALDMRATDHCDLLLDAAQPRRLSVRASRETWPGELITPGSNRIVALCPSPSAADVSVELQIGEAGMVDLGVFDVQGRAVDRLFSGPLEGGHHERTWSPARSGVVSGVYFVKLRTPAGEDTRRVVIIRG